MMLNAIDQASRARIDRVTDAYDAERSPAAQRTPVQTDSVAGAYKAHSANVQPAPAYAHTAAGGQQRKACEHAATETRPATWLSDQYASERLQRAVRAFIDEQTRLQERADAANDLGTIQGLLPLQPYRVAIANPWVQPQQLIAAAGVQISMVAPVANVAGLRSAMDDALSTDAHSRARRAAT